VKREVRQAEWQHQALPRQPDRDQPQHRQDDAGNGAEWVQHARDRSGGLGTQDCDQTDRNP